MSLSWEEFCRLAVEFARLSEQSGDSWEWKTVSNEYGGAFLQNTSHVVNGLICHLHIVYSPSFSCPVLYFNVYELDGRLVPLQTLWKNLKIEGNKTEDELWKTVTQSQHPLLQIPFYMTHPCETSSFMKSIAPELDNYLLSWLSIYGSVVNLNMSAIRDAVRGILR